MRWVVCLLLLFPNVILAQQVVSYAEQGNGSSVLALGYPVPIPVASLEPMDGFREYNSLMARLHGMALESDDLRAVSTGMTHAQRSIWAFVVSTPAGLDREGLPKPAFYLNGTTHAREWGVPELAAATIEHLMEGRAGSGVERFLLDNTRLVIVPVQNVDGFLQTQRYPSQAIIGRDPRFPASWPRDGRMRRKNMAGVDELLFSFADHLGGVDLNRNLLPFWASSSQSSANPAELVYHGSAPHSEPEVQAMLSALELAPASQLRLGIDLHSFTQVFFSSNTGNVSLLAIQNQLLQRLALHHRQVSRSARFPAGRVYQNVPDPPSLGIGAHAEYFAYEFGVPSWTLEIEPGNGGGAEYGGTGVSHSGFVLPSSEVRRVADAWAQSHQVAFYFMAGPPHLAGLEIDALGGFDSVPRYRGRWHLQGSQREWQLDLQQPLRPGQLHRARLRFSKPMRIFAADGTVDGFPGLELQQPAIALLLGEARVELQVSAGRWLSRAQGAWRYDGDTFEFEFSLPGDMPPGEGRFAVDAFDMVGLRLDSDPQTPVDWAQGLWQGYGDGSGGEDRSGQLELGVAEIEVLSFTAVRAEGEAVLARVRRGGSIGAPLSAALCDPRLQATDIDCQALTLAWGEGEQSEFTLQLPLPDDARMEASRRMQLPIYIWTSLDDVRTGAEIAVEVLDNDREGMPVLRVGANRSLAVAVAEAAALHAVSTDRVDLVLDGGTTYRIGAAVQDLPLGKTFAQSVSMQATGRLRVFANGAMLVPGDAPELEGSDLIAVLPDAELELRDARIRAADASPIVALGNIIRNDGTLTLRRTHVADMVANNLLDNRGQAAVEGSWFDGLDLSGALLVNAGEVSLRNSTVSHSRGALAHSIAGRVELDSISVLDLDTRGALLQGGVQIGSSLLAAYRVLGSDGLPNGEPACTAEVESLGFNRVGDDCGLFAEGDQRGPQMPSLSLDRERGGLPPPSDAIDAIPAARCTAVDQLASPRPQSTAMPARCDIGSLESGLAPFRGFWIPDRPGHGIDMQTAANTLFIGWYTYDSDGQPTLYSAAAPLAGPIWKTSLQSSRRDGSGAIERFEVGEVEIHFESDTNARLIWRFDEGGLHGEEGIRAYLFDSEAPRIELTGTWYPPADSGWGASIARQGERTGVVLYYYDADGAVRWALGIGDAGDVTDVQVLHHTGFCPNCDSAANPVQTRVAGLVRVQMLNPELLEISTDLSYPDSPGGAWQKDRAVFRALSTPVDNGRLRRQLNGGDP